MTDSRLNRPPGWPQGRCHISFRLLDSDWEGGKKEVVETEPVVYQARKKGGLVERPLLDK